MTDTGRSAALRRLRGNIAAALRGYFKTGDIMIISVLLSLSAVLAAAALLPAGSEDTGAAGTYAVITRGGEQLARLPLDTDAEFVISGTDAYNVVTISDGRVYMSGADCPDRLCVSQGAVSRPGQIIVCLPNKVVITVESDDGGEVDSVSY